MRARMQVAPAGGWRCRSPVLRVAHREGANGVAGAGSPDGGRDAGGTGGSRDDDDALIVP